MKKFPGVYAWVEEYNAGSQNWDTNLVVLERGEPIPVIKKYNVQNKTCTLTDEDGATSAFALEEEDE